MKHDRAMELVAALRSGKYRQCHGTLHEGDGFCCLGVACDISGLGQWKPEYNGHPEYLGDNEYLGSTNVLPRAVMEHFGFHNNVGGFPTTSHLTTLTELNDHGWSFEQIADFIEKNWESL